MILIFEKIKEEGSLIAQEVKQAPYVYFIYLLILFFLPKIEEIRC